MIRDRITGGGVVQLRRELGLAGAVVTGLGSIVGTGVFVSLAVAAGMVGPAVIPALAAAALVAACNGLSSAQLAANHPVSGGTYEYGYRFLHPTAGFVAGIMFLSAKSASAATAALGFSGYVLGAFGVTDVTMRIVGALVAVALVTVVVLSGLRRTGAVNAVIVSVTVGSLLFFVVLGLANVPEIAGRFEPFLTPEAGDSALTAFLGATAFLFVSYTGYGRIATLGEEVKEPRRVIPRAVVVTLLVSMLLYAGVAVTGVSLLGSDGLADAAARGAAPLEEAARATGLVWLPIVLAVGAAAAMFGVLLNLLLGLSRVFLAMGRRGDMPRFLARIDSAGRTPAPAVLAAAAIVAAITFVGEVRVTWSFSAFTVLVYYALTNAAALRISGQGRLFPRWVSAAGLVLCLGLAVFVELSILAIGAGIIVVAALVSLVLQRMRRGA